MALRLQGFREAEGAIEQAKIFEEYVTKSYFANEDDDFESLKYDHEISYLQMKESIVNRLNGVQINTIGDLCSLSMDDLRLIPRLGARSIENIENALHKFGFNLKT